MQADDICGIRSPFICFGVNREIFCSKILQSDFLEVILATEGHLSSRHSPRRSGKHRMEVKRGFLTTPSGLSSWEWISYHPNLLFRQIKLKLPLAEFTCRNLLLENFSTSQSQQPCSVQHDGQESRGGTSRGLNLALPITYQLGALRQVLRPFCSIFTSKIRKILSVPTSDVF